MTDPDCLWTWLFQSLGGQFATNFDDCARGEISVSEIVCLRCETAPCSCVKCECGWTKAPDKACEACD